MTVRNEFTVTVEVVPPAGPDAEALLAKLEAVSSLPFDGYSVATNPVARPRMSALALSVLVQERTGKPATLHCTTRDHNRLSIQGLLWGARALDIDSVLISTGDFVALGTGARTTTVRDVDVFDLVRMAREADLYTGVVLDPRPETGRLDHEIRRLEHKIEAGAQFVVTQPVFARDAARELGDATAAINVPISLGILPLRSANHARFLHDKVAGIAVSQEVRARMVQATDPKVEGLDNAREMLDLARQWFAGACIMPPFGHYHVLHQLLGGESARQTEGKQKS